MYLFKTKIIKNQPLTSGITRLRIASAEDFYRQAGPGRFVMLGSDNHLSDTLLKRPFGICSWGDGWFEVIIKVVGKGSAELSQLPAGAPVSVNGPLGVGYPTIKPTIGANEMQNTILVAGGMGIASIASCLLPQVQADKWISTSGVLLYGAANVDELILLKELEQSSLNLRIKTITDDGSSGRKGFVTELLADELQKSAAAITFACGPEPMLKSVQQVLDGYNAKGYLSLENRMACGFGVCLGCVQAIAGSDNVKSAKVCTQGPVFPADEVIF